MNNEGLKELAAVLKGIADGKEWECLYGSLNRFNEPAGRDVEYCVANRIPIRLKQWHLPDPPHGYVWHRLDGWTEEMLPDGWRPLLLGERPSCGDHLFANNCWMAVNLYTPAKSYEPHQRTQRPLSSPKPKLREVPLCADDIKAGDEFLSPDGNRRQWQKIDAIGLTFGWVLASWAELRQHGWKIRSIGETEWRKCSKQEEVPA